MFSPMQMDVLTELLNVHIGLAASVLSEMVHQKIILSIPEIEFVPSGTINISQVLPKDLLVKQRVISSIEFGPNFAGKAFLIYPIDQAKVLARTCMGSFPVGEKEQNLPSLNAIDYDILKEISNVVFNALIGEFGNLLETKLEYTIPDINRMVISETDKQLDFPKDVNMLILHTNILLADKTIYGKMMILLVTNSLSLLMNKIDALLGDLNV